MRCHICGHDFDDFEMNKTQNEEEMVCDFCLEWNYKICEVCYEYVEHDNIPYNKKENEYVCRKCLSDREELRINKRDNKE